MDDAGKLALHGAESARCRRGQVTPDPRVTHTATNFSVRGQ